MSDKDLRNRKDRLSPEKQKALAQLLKGNRTQSTIQPRPIQGEAPLSPAQNRLWFLEQLFPDTPMYNMSFAIRIKGSLNIPAMDRSFQEIIHRHEVLRTSFAIRDGKPIQIIHSKVSFNLPVLDLSSSKNGNILLKRIIKEKAREPFQLQQAPLLRAYLFSLEKNEHILLFIMHHIVSDGWSMGVLLREFVALYQAFSKNITPNLPQLSIQYGDYAYWQVEKEGQEDDQKDLQHWIEKLADAPPALQWPSNSSRMTRDHRGGRLDFTLSPTLTEQLKQLGKEKNCTLFMILMAAYKVLLYRYSGQADLVVGTPVANRNRGQLEHLIGFFVNTLPVRSHLSGNMSFTDYLNELRKEVLQAFQYQHVPLEKIVEQIAPQRDTDHSPLFQTTFVLQNTPFPTTQVHNLKMEIVNIHTETAKFDLNLSMMETDEGMIGAFEYRKSLFSEETISRLAQHFITLLEGVVTNPDHAIDQFPLMTEEEEHRLLTRWTSNFRTFPQQMGLHHRFEKQVQLRPKETAIQCGMEKITYQELNQRANQVAHKLLRLGIQPNDLVGLCTDRKIEMIVGLLGILKAGAAYVPLDPQYPSERLSFMTKDANLSVLLVQDHLRPILSEHQGTVLCLDQLEEWTGEPSTNPHVEVTPDHLAYVIYTSGSTGNPKGVLVTHGNVTRLFDATNHWYHFTEKDVWSLFHSISFDFSVWELWGALLYGGKLVIVPQETTRSPEDFYDLLHREQVTVLNQTPSAFRQLIQAEEVIGQKPLALRLIIFGGEALELQSLKPWFERHGDQKPQLVNMYGITETTVHVTYRPITMKDVEEGRPSVIGQPIPDLMVYLLDSHLQPVPEGVPGEMYVSGAGVTRGYLNRPDLTAKCFIANPFSEDPQDRLYKTGDLARYLPDGDIEYLGRIDHQVKIRGFRIELGEIEQVLNQHPAVRESVALVTEEQPDDKRIVAYLVPDEKGLNKVLDNQDTTKETVLEWKEVFDNNYQKGPVTDDPTFNIVGWNSRLTGKPIPTEDMKEWLDHTVDRILSHSPSQVLEIGCGTGMLLFRIAPHCHRYVATDFSQEAIHYVQEHLTRTSFTEKVQLEQRAADQLEGLEENSFDMVILNSIIQYFPSPAYLIRTLQQVVSLLKPGGKIFIGDIRNLHLLPMFYTEMETRADSSLPVPQLQRRVAKWIRQENELVVAPAYFTSLPHHLPRIKQADIFHKRGHHQNELNRYRYDVVLHVEEMEQKESSVRETQTINWLQSEANWDHICDILQKEQPDSLLIKGIPNARLDQGNKITSIQSQYMQGEWSFEKKADPEQVSALEKKVPYRVEITWSGTDAEHCFDAWFIKADKYQNRLPVTIQTDPQTSRRYTNNPLLGKMIRDILPEVRHYLKNRLPDFMVPSHLLLLEKIPLTTNGKLDYKALPTPGDERLDLVNPEDVPRNQMEHKVAALWMETLGLDQIGIHDSFFELGGHSLLATQLIFKLREAFNTELPVRVLFEYPTIAGMTEILHQQLTGELSQTSSKGPDLEEDISLDATIQAQSPFADPDEPPKNILLTGATGFMGAFLLRELLEQTKAQIYCLVRANTTEEAFQRLQKNLSDYRIWDDDYRSRIQPIVGDLGLPKLGLEKQTFDLLSKNLDSIVHNGALVNFLYPYTALRASNVLGSEEILRLASQSRVKPVHFISTLYVFSSQDAKELGKIDESDIPRYWESLTMGYTQSKWAAEQLMFQARSRGIPVNIYRPGRISGDTKKGACQTNDFQWRFISACLHLGMVPKIKAEINLTPVDFISKAIIHLVHRPQEWNTAYHFINPHSIPWNEWVDWMEKFGYPLKRGSLEEWKQELLAFSQAQPDSDLATLFPLVANMDVTESVHAFDGADTLQALNHIGIPYPSMEDTLLEKYYYYFIEQGFFPPVPQEVKET